MTEDRTIPLEGQVLRHSELRGVSSGPEGADRENPVKDATEATVITSEVAGSDMHKVVLDIDMPVKVVESTTPGHFHLFIDKELDWSDYSRLLWVLADIGIIEEGYASSSAERGYTAVRLPWIKKIKNKIKTMLEWHNGAPPTVTLMQPLEPIRFEPLGGIAPPRLNDGYYRGF